MVAKGRSLFCLAAIFSAVGPLTARGEAGPSASPSPEELIRQMSAELGKEKAFRFHAEINFDDVLVSGQKLQYAGAVDVTVRRPDGVYIDYRDDLSAKRFWYDGKTGTLVDLVTSSYSVAALPGEIDAAVDQLQKRYALSLPLADLISSDHFGLIDELAIAWSYVGVHDVEGAPAHHVAILGENADLQLWIQKDGRPLPLKLVITYHRIDEAPQYQAVLMDWELGGRIAADTFRPALPKAAERIQFLAAEDRK